MNKFIEQTKELFDAVRALRKKKLGEGNTFMINTPDPGTPCYLEYPDGKICEVTLLPSKRDFRIIRNLTQEEAQNLRVRFQLQ